MANDRIQYQAVVMNFRVSYTPGSHQSNVYDFKKDMIQEGNWRLPWWFRYSLGNRSFIMNVDAMNAGFLSSYICSAVEKLHE